MMMALGMFIFSLQTASYQELQRVTNWRHPSNSRVGERPAYQFIGKGEDSISLKGVIMHELSGNRMTLDMIREMGDTGKAYTLLEGTGKIYGLVTINDLEEGKTFFFNDGAARKTEFTIKLTIIRDWQQVGLGSVLGLGFGALNRMI